MKTKIITLSVLTALSITTMFAQDRTTVSAYNSEISDNLDLRAVASIFGDSRDLADFERRLNDPEIQISNLDLNQDNKVDYLRVIETVEGNAHIIVIQSVLGRDTYQDVATVEVERDRDNRVQVQVVGDVYMYGPNYIYEPVYSYTPVIYTTFWISNYRPYYSSWYWDYYPTYYYTWAPCPIFRYRNYISININFHHHYNYVNYRRCQVAYNGYYRGGHRGNAYEVRYPNRSFGVRNTGYANRYELDQHRNIRTVSTRNNVATTSPRNNGSIGITPRTNATSPRNNNTAIQSPRSATVESSPRGNTSPRTYGNIRNNESPRTATVESSPRGNTSPRTYGNIRNNESSPRTATVESSPRGNGNVRSYESPRNSEPRANATPRSYEAPRGNSPREMTSPRGNSSPREYSSQRGNAQRNNNSSRGNRRS